MTSRMLRIAAVATLALLLAGCGRFHVTLEVGSDNTVTGDIVVAMIVGEDENARENAQSAADDLEQRLLPGLRDADGVTVTAYDEDGYLGTRLALIGTPISALEGSDVFTFERDGDVFQFSGNVELNPDGEGTAGEEEDVVPDEGERDVVISLRFPGEVTSHNGDADGDRVEWVSDWNGTLDMRATAMAEPQGPPVWTWVAGGIVLLLLVSGIVLAATRDRRAPAD